MFFSDYKQHPVFEVNPALLWDVDLRKLDYAIMKNHIVARVVERGRFDDFYAILNLYGEAGVKEAMREIAVFDDKDMSFISLYFDIPLTELRCYKRKQLMKPPMNY